MRNYRNVPIDDEAPGVVNPVGMLGMVDDKGIDEKILAVAQHDPRFRRVDDLAAVEPHLPERNRVFL